MHPAYGSSPRRCNLCLPATGPCPVRDFASTCTPFCPSGSERSDCHESPRVGHPPAECGVPGDTRLSTRTNWDTRAPAAFHISESTSRGTTTQDTSRNCENPTTPPIIYAVGATPGLGQCLRNFETHAAGQRKSDEKPSNPIGLRSPAVTLGRRRRTATRRVGRYTRAASAATVRAAGCGCA